MNIDGYQQFELLGTGGYSRVWKAFEPSFGRHVAVKVLSFDVVDQSAQRSFERECRAMGRVSAHPNIVTVHGNGTTDDGRLYIAMEFFAGGNYNQRLKTGAISIRDVLSTGVKIASALATAHQAGILHRDIKPANILVSSYGEPALGDFGISTIDRERTSTGTAGMTVHFAPPEVLNGQAADVRSDIYSLGATLWAMLEGKKPFHNATDASMAVTAVRIMNDPVPPITQQHCPPELRGSIARMMAKRREHRYASALEVAERLRVIQVSLGHPPTDIVYRVESGTPPSTDVEPSVPRSTSISNSRSRSVPSRPPAQPVAVRMPAPRWQVAVLGSLAVTIVVLLLAIAVQLAG